MKFPRVFSLLLVCVMLASTCLGAVPCDAAETGGLTFTATDLYAPEDGLTQSPNTFEAWIKVPKGTNTRMHILSNKSTGNSLLNFDVLANGRLAVIVTDAKGKTGNFIYESIDLRTNEWTHVAVARDLAAKTVNFYINGKLKETIPLENSKNADKVWMGDFVPAAPLCLGGNYGIDNTEYFRGTVRSAAVFSTTRTAAEVASDMNNTPLGANGLLTYYDLANTKPGDNIYDLSGNGYDITYRRNRTWVKPADKTPVTDYAYSFAVLGDIQELNYKFPQNFFVPFNWILDNADSKKIKYVFGLGDTTDSSSAAEWTRAQQAFHSLESKVGFSIVRGNHDKKDDYDTYFPWESLKNTHNGSFDGTTTRNTYRLFDVGEVKYLFINLDFGIADSKTQADKILAWAGALCEQYPDRNVVVSTHTSLYVNGKPNTENDHVPPSKYGYAYDGDDIWNLFLSKHANITLVLSGHCAGNKITMAQDKGVNGNTVTQLLVNTSSVESQSDAGLGMVAMLYFSADGKNVQVEYYSTVKNEYYRDISQFSFGVDVVGAENSAPGCEHDWVAATCTAPKTCINCGVTEGAALGHAYTEQITQAATCITEGVKTLTCQNDPTHTFTATVPVTDHTFSLSYDDESGHFQWCTGCGQVGAYADHVFTDDNDAVCDDCGFSRQDAPTDSTDPTAPEGPSAPPTDNSWVVIVVIAGVVVLAAAGGVTFWLLKRKKNTV